MKKLGLIVNTQRPRAGEVLSRIEELAQRLGLTLYGEDYLAPYGIRFKKVTQKTMLAKVDAVVALGGDGTMLRAARALNGRTTPLMGVNIGSLGFLTSVSEEELERAMEVLATDTYVSSIRSVLDCKVIRGRRVLAQYRALNDVVIHTGAARRVMSLDVSIGKEAVTTYLCDGLILSTPTGSTGHGLSAGGPILTPSASVFVIGLICPHSLSSRPLVIDDGCEVSVKITKCEQGPVIKADGQIGMELQKDDIIRISRSAKSVRFIHLPGYSYFAVLRQKLKWKGSTL